MVRTIAILFLSFFLGFIGNAYAKAVVPISPWVGRLILPAPEEVTAKARENEAVWAVDSVKFEVLQSENPALIGKTIWLSWADVFKNGRNLRELVSYHMSKPVKAEAKILADMSQEPGKSFGSYGEGDIAPLRLHQWSQKGSNKIVGPLTSIAGYHYEDDMIVSFESSDLIQMDDEVFHLAGWPTAVSGSQTALVRFIESDEASNTYEVEVFNSNTGEFERNAELTEIEFSAARINSDGSPSFNTAKLFDPKLNETGYYIYGDFDQSDSFIVKALEPLVLTRPASELPPATEKEILEGVWEGMDWTPPIFRRSREAWKRKFIKRKGDAIVQKIGPKNLTIGDKGMAVHIFGGVGGENGDGQVLFRSGHASFGSFEVTKHPASGLPWIKLKYHQVYGNGAQAIPPVTSMYHYYAGSIRFGWAFHRPMSDVLVHSDFFEHSIELKNGGFITPLDGLVDALEEMMHGYRIGFGKLVSIVNPVTSCVQDSALALVLATERFKKYAKYPKEMKDLVEFVEAIRARSYTGIAKRSDWVDYINEGLRAPSTGWRIPATILTTPITLTPRFAFDMIVRLLKSRANAGQQIFTNQIVTDLDEYYRNNEHFGVEPNSITGGIIQLTRLGK